MVVYRKYDEGRQYLFIVLLKNAHGAIAQLEAAPALQAGG